MLAAFKDMPEPAMLKAVIDSWYKPEAPSGLASVVSTFRAGGEVAIRRRLSQVKSRRYRSQLEVKVISWLYNFIRANVKRGRVFDLCEVLQKGRADCLGYAKLFTLLGRLAGLDAGVIEVVTDNKGRYVPHTAALVRLSDQRRRFVDLWYGSRDIKHFRMGLWVKQGGAWKITDLDLPELGSQEVCYLPDYCVDAITLYIRGNRSLNRQEFDSAVRYYSKAIELYPTNARLFYNRAIAYENLGEHNKADADYARALSDEASQIRVLAVEHDEVASLINLDTDGVDERTQEMYLLHRGFATGKEVPLAGIARRFGLSEAEAAAILSLDSRT